MTRYSSIDEVNAALLELQEHERTASTEDSETRPKIISIALNGGSTSNITEDNGKAYEGAAESDSYSDHGSLEGHHDDEEELYGGKSDDGFDGEDDDEDSGAVDSDDDDRVQVRQKAVVVDPKEEEEFDRELRSLVQESVESRRVELRARPTLNMMIPMNVFEGSKDPRAVDGESGEETVDDESGSSGVRVKVLVKKGNKQQTKQMLIPRDCSLVQSTKQKEAEEMEEKQNIKRKILEYNEREEEESVGVSSPAMNWINSAGSDFQPLGRGGWDGSGRTGSLRPRQHSSRAFYHGYGRRR